MFVTERSLERRLVNLKILVILWSAEHVDPSIFEFVVDLARKDEQVRSGRSASARVHHDSPTSVRRFDVLSSSRNYALKLIAQV